jgi:glycine/D-amino acid oxidase-like deaminating enzyme
LLKCPQTSPETRRGVSLAGGLDWAHSGSLKIARRSEDAEVIQADYERARRMGLDVELMSPEAACRLNPFLRPKGVVATMRIGDDRYFDPAQVAVGFARAAAAKGVELPPRTDVHSVEIEEGKVQGVRTAGGAIGARIVVDAAGAWTRQVAEASGSKVPLVPTRQQLIVTEPVEGAPSRPADDPHHGRGGLYPPGLGGFLWGVYEEAPCFFDMAKLARDFHIKDMPLDIEVLKSAAAEVCDQIPLLETAKVREFRGGIPTMTPDGHHILGPAPDVEGFFFASGCSVAGLSISPTVGEVLAAWIVDGRPQWDLSPMSIERFRNRTWDEAQLQREAAWQYRHFTGPFRGSGGFQYQLLSKSGYWHDQRGLLRGKAPRQTGKGGATLTLHCRS